MPVTIVGVSPRDLLRWHSAAVTTGCLQDRVRFTTIAELGAQTLAWEHFHA
jgi:ligand-binding SRPBCC domain-containing protein